VRESDYKLAKNAVRSSLRQSFRRSSVYQDFIKSQRIEITNFNKDGSESKRKGVRFKCNICGELFKRNEIDIDHIIPIGRGIFETLKDTERWAKLLFCEADNLQVACKLCHKEKTKRERKAPSYDNLEF
jgi:5-methylcytosine-specific restriction endonuclease McrA